MMEVEGVDRMHRVVRRALRTKNSEHGIQSNLERSKDVLQKEAVEQT